MSRFLSMKSIEDEFPISHWRETKSQVSLSQ